jgi:hypothetical protein
MIVAEAGGWLGIGREIKIPLNLSRVKHGTGSFPKGEVM